MSTWPLTGSAKLYQERRQPAHRTTRRSPAFHHDLAANPAVRLALLPPYPPTEALQAEAFNSPEAADCCLTEVDAERHPPNAGATDVWPHGVEEVGGDET